MPREPKPNGPLPVAEPLMWPTAGFVNVQIEGELYQTPFSARQMIWMSARFAEAAAEMLKND